MCVRTNEILKNLRLRFMEEANMDAAVAAARCGSLTAAAAAAAAAVIPHGPAAADAVEVTGG